MREIPENFRNGFPEGGTLIKPSAGHVKMSLYPSSGRNTAWNLGETDQNESSTSIGSPKRHAECTNNASKCQFALSSPHSFVICRAPQALNLKSSVDIYRLYL